MNEPKQTQRTITLENVRLSYAYLEPNAPKTGTNDQGQATKNWCAHGIMTPDHPGIALVRDAQKAVALAAWGEQPTAGADAQGNAITLPMYLAVLNQLAAQDKLALHNGNISKAGQEAYAGKFYVSANNSKQPPRIVVTRGGVNVDIAPGDPCFPYSGCWANLVVAVYAQLGVGKQASYGKRVNVQLMGVQFLRHDTRFGGGRVASMDEFKIAPTEADGAVPMAAANAAGASGLV